MAGFKVRSGETFLFIGDSITDCGRRDEFAPLGNGYVRQVVDLVTARYPERDIRFINTGVGGNNVLDLQARWAEDVLRHSPGWLSVKIGINDIHQTQRGGNNIPPPVFEEAYRDILTRAREHCDPKMMLIDPFYISTDRSGASFESTILAGLAEYIAVVHRLAEEFGFSDHTDEVRAAVEKSARFGLSLQERDLNDRFYYGGLYGQSSYGTERDRIHHRSTGYSINFYLKLTAGTWPRTFSSYGWGRM